MNQDVLKHGAFSWFELMTTDVAGAKEFYGELFGWETEDQPMGFPGYTMIKVDGDGVGGIMQPPQECKEMTPFWGVYVTVKDVDAIAENVERLGGKLLRAPMDIPQVGRFCVIQDPQGAVINAITYKHGEM